MAGSILDALYRFTEYANGEGPPGAVHRVWCYYAHRADAMGWTWANQSQAARALDLQRETVARALKALIRGEYMRSAPCDGMLCAGHPHRRTPHYYLCPIPGEKDRMTQRQKRPRGRPRKYASKYASKYARG